MKKISLKNFNLKDVEQLSRVQLKNVLGGYTAADGEVPTTSCVRACGVDGRGPDDDCVTTDCVAGTCSSYMGIYGCN